MLSLLKKFFNENETENTTNDSNLELLCGLMIEAANSDGNIETSEIEKINSTLINIFDEDPNDVNLVLD